MKRRSRIADTVLLGLFTLYLCAALLTVGGPAPASFGAVWDWQDRAAVGPIGLVMGQLAFWLLGPLLRWALLPLAVAGMFALHQTVKARRRLGRRVAWGSLYALLLAGLLGHPAWARFGVEDGNGGVVGAAVEGLLRAGIGSLGSFLLLACAVAYAPMRRLPPLHLPWPALDGLQERAGVLLAPMARLVSLARRGLGALGERLAWPKRRGRTVEIEIDDDLEERSVEVASAAAAPAEFEEIEAEEDEYDEDADEGEDEYEEYEDEEYEEEEEGQSGAAASVGGEEFLISRDPSELLRSQEVAARRKRRRGDYALPSLDLLDDVPKEERGFTKDVLQMKARLLMETLAHYGIEGRINEIRPGPVVTTFEFEPAPGVKVSSITSRQDDLALAMKATRIRIEAPIPGKAAVGIEIPNPYPQMVTLKEVIASLADDDKAGPLSIALGKDTEGVPHVADIAEMPHLLVAGATGSGKSVCINAIICNLLLRNGPDRLRMLMVDPKMLELSVYNGIPHLLHPVITEPREALKAVKWAVAEMTTRYHKLAKHGVRNIADFNTRVREGKVKDADGNKVREEMAHFVLIIDELADLMMQLGQDLETPVARLAQMARAVGIHLVLATQRPSVNVITGVIKANFPSRIAFRVMSKVDSRTILDAMGAEQLLGKGDMLFLLAGSPQPVRVHGAYINVEECERIVEHWQQYTEEDSELDLDVGETGPGGVDLGEDELLDEAKRLVVMTQMGSTSMLQRRLRVGYTRAARLMDMLEAAGVVGPFEGSKAREVLVSKEELEAQA